MSVGKLVFFNFDLIQKTGDFFLKIHCAPGANAVTAVFRVHGTDMRILVIRLSSMGDCILVTSLFSFLTDTYKGAAITFMTDSAFADLFADDPRLAEVIGVDGRTEESPLADSLEWDLVIDLQNNSRSRSLLASVRTRGAPMGVFNKLHWKRFMLLTLRFNTYSRHQHVAARYIQAAGGNPLNDDMPPVRLFFGEGACERVRNAFNARTVGILRPAIALFPFSAWKNKEWPAQNFINIGRYFITKGWNVAIMGGPSDSTRAEWMKELIGNRCVSLAGKLSLYECGCLLTSFMLALGNDTGLSHMARACGIKTGILYGPTTWHFGFYAFGRPPFVIFEEQLLCRPCHAHGGNLCMRLNRKCMRNITYNRVISGLEELICAR